MRQHLSTLVRMLRKCSSVFAFAALVTLTARAAADTWHPTCDEASFADDFNDARNFGGVIHLPPGCTITLNSGLLPVVANVIIEGHDGGLKRLDSAAQFRFFSVESTGTLRLRDLTLDNGKAPNGANGSGASATSSAGGGAPGSDGGAIHNQGTLVLEGVTIVNSEAGNGGTGGSCWANFFVPPWERGAGDGGRGGLGGAIFNAGTLEIVGSRLSNNTAGQGGVGGGCSYSDLEADGGSGGNGGGGGAIWSEPDRVVKMQYTTLHNNDAGSGGRGGIGAGDERIGGGGHGGEGGGIAARGPLEIQDSQIEENAAGHGGLAWVNSAGTQKNAGNGGNGGGISMTSGYLKLFRSTVSWNVGGHGDLGYGGGKRVYSSPGHGGGIYVDVATELENVTIASNTASVEACASGGNGGGLAVGASGAVQLRNVTFSDNLPGNKSRCREGVTLINDFEKYGVGGSIYNLGTVRSKNTILLTPVWFPGTPSEYTTDNCTGTGSYLDEGHNITWNEGFDDNPGLVGGVTRLGCPSTFLNTGTKLPGIAHNSGLGLDLTVVDPSTVTPQPGSSAINAGSATSFLSIDERGVTRPQGAGYDIGAVEVTPASITKNPADITVATGASAGFAVEFDRGPDGIGTPTAQWQRSNDGGATWSNIGGATHVQVFGNGYATTYTLSSTSKTDNGARFRAIVNNGSGAGLRTSASAKLNVTFLEILQNFPASVTGNVGSRFSLRLQYVANPAVGTVSWQVSSDGGSTWSQYADPYGGLTSETTTFEILTTDAMFAAPAGSYRYRVVLSGGLAGRAPLTSAVATLTVTNNPDPPRFTSGPFNMASPEGLHRMQFYANVAGNPFPSIEWQRSTDNGLTWTTLQSSTPFVDTGWLIRLENNQTQLSFAAKTEHDDNLFRALLDGTVSSSWVHFDTRVMTETLIDCPAFVLPGERYTCTATAHMLQTGNPRLRKPCGTVNFRLNNAGAGACELDAAGQCSIELPEPGPLGTENRVEAQYVAQELRCSDGLHVADDGPFFDWASTTVTSADCLLPEFLECPASRELAAGEDCTATTPDLLLEVVVGSLGCEVESVTQSPEPGTVLSPGIHEITFTATTAAGSSSCMTTIVVSDLTPPEFTISGPDPLRVQCKGAINPTEGVTAHDNCDGPMSFGLRYPDGPFDSTTPGTYVIEYITFDSSRNQATARRTVIVEDTTAPVLTRLGPSAITVSCGDPRFVDPGATANDSCEGPLSVTTSGTVDWGTPGNYTLTYEATDVAGNKGSVTRSISILDMEPPTIQLNGEQTITLQCGAPFEDPGVSASDACSGSNVTVTVHGTVNSAVPGPYPLTYEVRDPAGNGGSISRLVLVQGGGAPGITLDGPNPATVDCRSPYVEPGASAQDSCGGPVPVTISGTVDINRPGSYQIEYSATSGGVTQTAYRTVNVADTQAPTITLNGSSSMTIECHGSFTDPGATANDSCAGSFAASVSGSVNVNVPGVYTLTYNASDPSGNAAVAVTRTVTVSDTQKPAIKLNGTASMTVECHGSFTDPGATANDVCAGSVAVTPSGTVDVNTPGSYQITYTANDGNGNSETAYRTVNVVDSTKPTITMNGDSSVTVECHGTYTDASASASDTCAGTLPVTPISTVNVNVPGSYTVTYEATDAAGNKQTAARNVTVSDTTKPTISLNGSASMTVECHTSFTDPGATANDSCAGSFAATPSGFVNVNVPGVYTLTYSASDPSGNAATAVTRTVTVVDTTKPTIQCPANITVAAVAGSCAAPATFNVGHGDTCDGAPRLVLSHASGSSFPLGVTTVNATVTDASGNSSSCSFTVTVVKSSTSTSVSLLHASRQYSDASTFTANVVDTLTSTPVNGGTVTFRIGGSVAGTSALVNGTASLSLNLVESATLAKADLAPGGRNVTATYNGDSPTCAGLSTSGAQVLTITKEDARTSYTGGVFSSTSCPSCSDAVVTLSATVWDITATPDAAGDTLPGDIRNATVTFLKVDGATETPIGTVNVGLVNAGDTKVGVATYNWNVSIGSSDSEPYTIGVRINGYYTRSSSNDYTVVTVAKPIGTNFISGGGYLTLTSSAGLMPGDAGTKNNFGFNVKYNKSGNSLQGRINTILRRKEADGLVHVYQIKGNAMTSLTADAKTGKAVFNGKANITDVTDPLAPITVDGNGTLTVTMTDKGEPGSSDSIGISLFNKSGGLWFSSHYENAKTVEKVLNGGNLVVR